MSRLARKTARLVWWLMLLLMRRPWMKWLQRASLKAFPRWLRGRARRSFVRQNSFARRYGLRILTVVFTVFYASLAINVCYETAIWMADSGILSPPTWMSVPSD